MCIIYGFDVLDGKPCREEPDIFRVVTLNVFVVHAGDVLVFIKFIQLNIHKSHTVSAGNITTMRKYVAMTIDIKRSYIGIEGLHG